MKTPLQYQRTEYDCGPTSVLNAVSYLFGREQIKPDILRQTMLICLDCYGAGGACGQFGTSCTAMMFLSNWFNSYGAQGNLPVRSEYLRGTGVTFTEGSSLFAAMRKGGVAVVRLFLEDPHYVLVTRQEGDMIYLFDPYYRGEPFSDCPDIRVVGDHPFSYNRIVPLYYLEQETSETPYALGEPELREAVLFFNEKVTEVPKPDQDYTVRNLAAGGILS